MLLDHHRVVRDVTSRLPDATTPFEACRATISVLGRHTPAQIRVLLWSHDQLRPIADSGAALGAGSGDGGFQVPPADAVVSRVYTSGKAETPSNPRTGAAGRICTPIPALDGRPIGVLDLELAAPPDVESWRHTAEQVAGRLGIRIVQLGGPPAENRDERLLRHSTAIAEARSETVLADALQESVREVCGLSTGLLVLTGPTGPELVAPPGSPGPVSTGLHAVLDRSALVELVSRVRHDGVAHPAHVPEPLASAGVRTLIVVPFGTLDLGGVLLAVDELPLCPDPATVNLVRLLAEHGWACLRRLRQMAELRDRASSDPLTGLGHHGRFGERIAGAVPGRTALIAIDVDGFKSVNDRYGHQAGDRVLVDLARVLKDALRQGDELYRIGGDEFVAVVEVNRPEEAVGIAERLTVAARSIGRTISVGVAVQGAAEPAKSTLGRADAALYEVKRAGRDGVRLAAE